MLNLSFFFKIKNIDALNKQLSSLNILFNPDMFDISYKSIFINLMRTNEFMKAFHCDNAYKVGLHQNK